MEHRFDSLAKSVSGAISRRDAFWRLGSGLAVSTLALLGLGAGGPGKECAECCVTQCSGQSGHARGLCLSACFQGADLYAPPQCAGICGG
jgi:hypothetical protein